LNYQPQKISKYDIATAIAILFHAIGLVGILYFNEQFFISFTPYNLLLMLGLLVWTQSKKNIYFYAFLLICIITGIVVEIIGVNTNFLFGNYHYGNVLGPQVKSAPLIIGVNWFIIIFCCGISTHTLLSKLTSRLPDEDKASSKKIQALSIIFDGATLAVFFDWVMEPVAVKLGYWQWHEAASVPLFNYVCWFVISAALLAIFYFSKFTKHNKFAVNLLLIQLMFFLLLRTFN
jgi:putative membrane protein